VTDLGDPTFDEAEIRAAERVLAAALEHIG